MQQVLHHPLYKADPIQAITNHLASTLPPAPAKPATGMAAGTQGRDGRYVKGQSRGQGGKLQAPKRRGGGKGGGAGGVAGMQH